MALPLPWTGGRRQASESCCDSRDIVGICGSTRPSSTSTCTRHEVSDGLVLAREVENNLTVYNTIRPHEAIGFGVPLARYLQAPSTPPGANLQAPATVPDS
jgi:hypothetical protein